MNTDNLTKEKLKGFLKKYNNVSISNNTINFGINDTDGYHPIFSIPFDRLENIGIETFIKMYLDHIGISVFDYVFKQLRLVGYIPVETYFIFVKDNIEIKVTEPYDVYFKAKQIIEQNYTTKNFPKFICNHIEKLIIGFNSEDKCYIMLETNYNKLIYIDDSADNLIWFIKENKLTVDLENLSEIKKLIDFLFTNIM